MPRQDYRRAMTAKIKIGQNRLGLDDAVYRALLERVTGCRSTTQMSTAQMDAVLQEMKRLGFVPAAPGKDKAPKPRESAERMVAKIGAILADNKLPWNYAHATAKRMFGVDRVEWLSNGHLHKLTAALQIYADRHKARP